MAEIIMMTIWTIRLENNVVLKFYSVVLETIIIEVQRLKCALLEYVLLF